MYIVYIQRIYRYLVSEQLKKQDKYFYSTATEVIGDGKNWSTVTTLFITT